jgi:16S rRNA (uracil1498-N3)-methyltransferase
MTEYARVGIVSDHRRFFVDPGQIKGNRAVLAGNTARQIAVVLRLKPGDTVRLLDGTGKEHEARIEAVAKDEVVAEIASSARCAGEPSLRLGLAVCLPKGDKLDFVVQKSTELGISELIVVISERTVSRPNASKMSDRLARWRRIATEAAEQSGRGKAPEVKGIVEIDALPQVAEGYGLRLVAWEDEDGTSLKEALRAHRGASSVLLVVGPEGGLVEREALYLKAAGMASVSLGRRILRCETAAIAACAAIMYELEGEL